MAKRKSNTTPVDTVLDTVGVPARGSMFRFADVGRGPVPLGSHKSIHGAD